MLFTTGNVHKTSVISSIITGVVVAWLIILGAKKKKKKKKTLYITCDVNKYSVIHGLKRSLTPTIDPLASPIRKSTTDSYHCKVGIWLLRIQSIVVLNILEGLVHEASITAMIALRPRTVHQVLLTQRNQLSSFTEQLTLQGARWAESPARSTPFLASRNRNLLPNSEAIHAHFTLTDTELTKALKNSLINCLLGL